MEEESFKLVGKELVRCRMEAENRPRNRTNWANRPEICSPGRSYIGFAIISNSTYSARLVVSD